jgi:Uma2 family endonuclease
MSPEEYLAFEARSKVKHEYVDGFVYAMSGTTRRHNRILMNVAFRLRTAAGGGPCQVFVNDLKVRADETKFYYPDVGVVCTPEEDDEALVIPDPCLLVEVTSPSTRATDYRDKLAAYRRIPTLGAYLIASHTERLVDRYWRDAEGVWRHATITPDSGGRVPVPCPAAELALDDVYAGVTFRPRLRRLKEGPAAYATSGGGPR